MKYHDFRIRIEAKRGDGYDVSVESPAGSADEHIVLPFDVDEAIKHLHNMGREVRGSGATERKIVMDGPEPMKPSEFGDQLFRSLFTGRVGKLYNAMSRDLQDPDTGLRINLHLNLNDPGVGALAGVPWEFVYDADTMDYLNLSRQTPIVRYLDVQRPNTLQPLTGKLKVLVVMSSPKGEHQLDLNKERQLIESIWSGDDEVELTVKEHPTPNNLRLWLTTEQYHVLHYMGHGTHDENTGVGALVLEDEEQNAKLLDAETLGTFLRNAPTVRLAFLNACDLAKTDEDSPFSGVANRLVMAGLPAVVAMQFPISDNAAIAFARTFYARLQRGVAVDEAVAHGRNAILADMPGSMEWGTPVLYMRTPDGQLFDKQGAGDVAVDAPAAQPEPVAAPAVTDKVSRKGLGAAAAGIAAVVLAVVAGLFFFNNGRSTKLAFESNEVQGFIDQSVPLRFGPPGTPEDSAHLDRYDVSFAAPNATGLEISDVQEVDGFWRATAQASRADEFEIIATIKDNNKSDAEPRRKAAKLIVTVDPQVKQAHKAALASVKNTSSDTGSILQALNRLEGQGLNDEMRTELVGVKKQLQALVESERLARDGVADTTITLSEKIAAFEKWKTDLTAARGFAPTAALYPQAFAQLDVLNSRTQVEDFKLCTSTTSCPPEIRVAAGSRVYTVVQHNAEVVGSSVTVKYLAKPELTEVVKQRTFSLKGNSLTSDWSNLSTRGSFEARLYNADGDLLMSKPITVN